MSTLSQIFRSALYPIRFVADWIQRFLLSTWGFIISLLTILITPFFWLADFVLWLQSILILQVQKSTAILVGMWDKINDALSILMGPLAFVNSFIPINQLLVAFSLLLVLWVCALLYRFVKSLIPTMS